MKNWLYAVPIFLSASVLSAATVTHQPLGDGIEVISIAGDIAEGDEEKFRKFAVQFDKAIVILASDGGLLLPALEIGRAIHLRGFSTFVNDGEICASSCALIWVAGDVRYLAPKGRVGFHASYLESGGQKMETGVGNALVGRYLTQLQLPERSIIFATSAPPTGIRWLEAADQSKSGIDFKVLDANETSERPTIASAPARPSASSFEQAGEEAYRRGYELWSSGQHEKAISILRAIATAFPGHRRVSWANYLVGRTLLARGQPRAAAEVLLANYRSNPAGERAAESLYYLGQSTMVLRQPGQACKAYAELESVYGGIISVELKRLVRSAKLEAKCG